MWKESMIGDLGENLEKKISQLLDRLLKVIPTRPDIDWKETITAVWAADRWGGAFEAIEI